MPQGLQSIEEPEEFSLGSQTRTSREWPLRDPTRVASALAHPQAGPRILFLSGGSALRELSRVLPRYTHNSTHLITPFDSGGSSASLREAFGMLSVGDLRNRLLALADDGSPEAAAARACFGHRFDAAGEPRGAADALRALVAGTDPRIAELPAAQKAFGCETLGTFAKRMPADFDLRGASVGNLALTGAYLPHRDIRRALARFGEVLGVRGEVLPTSEENLHLAARLTDGSTVVGQHRLTGKEHPPLAAPIEEIHLVAGLEGTAQVHPPASTAATARIGEADLICLPMGSFYSSVVCNLLPEGIGRAIADAPCPKVYVPNTGHDPEMPGVDAARATAQLLHALRADAGETTPAERLIDRVLLDRCPDVYDAPPELSLLDRLGVAYSAIPLVRDDGQGRVDGQRLSEILVSLSRQSDRQGKEEH